MNDVCGKRLPEILTILASKGYLAKMYTALEDDGIASVIKIALDVVRNTEIVPLPDIRRKNSDKAASFIYEARAYLRSRCIDVALEKCNEMLLYAPKNSDHMFSVYYFRAKILCLVKAAIAGLNDIENCLAVMKPQDRDALEDLMKMKKELTSILPFENFKNLALQSSFGMDYFTFNMKRNKDINCAIADIGVVRENGLPKVVATKNIDVGKLVAVERAYVTHRNDMNQLISCYNCLKFNLNLIPCDGCCYALFCDEMCKKLCMDEFHRTECQIMDHIFPERSDARFVLPVRAALKMKQAKSWDELVAASQDLTADKLRNRSDSEIYDSRNTFSILNFNNGKHFVHGKIFNQSFYYAAIVNRLSEIPGYYPQDPKKRLEAMYALGSIMLHLFVTYPFEIEIINAAQNYLTNNVTSEPEPNFGWFSFANKLKHCCEPNLLVVGLNDKIGLVAVKPIKKGTELTICYMGHWYENIHHEGRKKKLFTALDVVCECRVCENNWSNQTTRSAKLEPEQLKSFRKWRATVGTVYPNSDKVHFKETCHALRVLQDLPNTEEHHQLFRQFRNSLNAFQYSVTENSIIMNSDFIHE
ncbi:uncharacterized protein LOC113510065 [Galleria mellonella]|uniref:Uncharacterized protein LOC113510065 n=1 Tax=Galleria mellonella TaxID=7137 RepID=A0ABM3N0X0_GALME|nr:uncharacterized protein LOC113510065 [Galleria mellonella]